MNENKINKNKIELHLNTRSTILFNCDVNLTEKSNLFGTAFSFVLWELLFLPLGSTF